MNVYEKWPILYRFSANWGEFVLPIFVQRRRISVLGRQIPVHGRQFCDRFEAIRSKEGI